MKVITANFGWKLLSLMIAVALWIAVAREPELATSIAVPIEFRGIPDDLDIGSNIPDHVRLEVRGPSGRLSRDNISDLAVILNLADASPGERTYNIRPASINLPSGVSFYRALPSQITLRFDKLLTKEVSIVPAPYLKGPPDGYRVRAISLDPDKTFIRGPEERVKSVSHVTLDPVDLSGGQTEFQTHVNLGDPQLRLEVPSTVILKVTMDKTAPEKTSDKETK